MRRLGFDARAIATGLPPRGSSTIWIEISAVKNRQSGLVNLDFASWNQIGNGSDG